MRPYTLLFTTCAGGCGGGLRGMNGWPMMLSRCGAIVAPIPRMGPRRTWSVQKKLCAPFAGLPSVNDCRSTTVTADGTERFTYVTLVTSMRSMICTLIVVTFVTLSRWT